MNKFIRELVIELAKGLATPLMMWLGVMSIILIVSVVWVVLIGLGIASGEISYAIAISIVTLTLIFLAGIAVFVFSIRI